LYTKTVFCQGGAAGTGHYGGFGCHGATTHFLLSGRLSIIV